MKIRAFLYAALLTVALAGLSAAQVDDRRSRGDHPARQMWAELNLTPEQEAKFRELNARHGPIRRGHSRQIEELRERINQELLKDKPARSLLAQLAGQMGETQKKMNIASVNHFLDLKAVLTAEQFAKFTERAQVGGSSGRGRRGADSGPPDDE